MRGQGANSLFYWIILVLILGSFIGLLNTGVNIAAGYFSDQEITKYLLIAIPVVAVIVFFYTPLNQILNKPE